MFPITPDDEMRIRFENIWLIVLLVGILTGCTDHEILDTYEEVGDVVRLEEEETLMPFDLEPYISSQTEATADTRADLNYLTYPSDNTGSYRISHFQYIPALGVKIGTNGWYGGNSANYNYRFGRTAYNSYMVGVFAYSHGTTDWDTAKASAEANLMTNQPILRLPNNPINDPSKNYTQDNLNTASVWKYTPKKYWPNGDGNKVTFIAYYPFQDYKTMEDGSAGTYYRNGEGTTSNPISSNPIIIDGKSHYDPWNDGTLYSNVDLTCIKPPYADADGNFENTSGSSAYTFIFKQKNNVREHIDFLMGITQNQTRKGVADNAANKISLKLCHTLTAVKFNITLNEDLGLLEGQTAPTRIEAIINSIGLEGLYTQGKVYPYIENGTTKFNWNNQQFQDAPFDNNLSNLVEFDVNNTGTVQYPFIKANQDDRPTFVYDGSTWTKDYNLDVNIYNNHKNGVGASDKYGENSRGYRYMLLVIPQYVEKEPDGSATTPAIREPKLVVNYTVKYTYSDGSAVYYPDQKSSLPLKDFSDGGALFKPGKMLTFNVKYNLYGIQMDATMADWDEEEYYNIEEGKGVVEE